MSDAPIPATVADPAYLRALSLPADLAAQAHPSIPFEGFPCAQRGGLPTPTAAALDAEIDRLIERHQRIL